MVDQGHKDTRTIQEVSAPFSVETFVFLLERNSLARENLKMDITKMDGLMALRAKQADENCSKRSIVDYTKAIVACKKGRPRWQEAMAMLREAESVACTPNVISFNATISVCEKAAEWQRAVALLEEVGTRFGSWCDHIQRSDECLWKVIEMAFGLGSLQCTSKKASGTWCD